MAVNYQAQSSAFVARDLSDLSSKLSVKSAEIPEPGDGEVLSKILLAVINPTDVHQVQGLRPIGATTFPQVSGTEALAEVVKCGPGVTDFKPGQRVVAAFWPCVFAGQGTWQTYIKGPQEVLVHVPEGMPEKVASQFVANPLTAYGLLDVAGVPKGEWLLQTGAGSVLGRMLIVLAKRWGIKTINVVRRSAQRQELLDLGADEVISTDEESIAKRTAEITGGKGVHASLDAVGGPGCIEVTEATRWGGTVWSYGELSAQPLQVWPRELLYKMKRVQGFLVGPWIQNLGERKQKVYDEVMGLLHDGTLKPLSGEVYPLKDVVKAIQDSQKVGRGGKLFLRP